MGRQNSRVLRMDKKYVLLWMSSLLENKKYPRLPMRLIIFIENFLKKDSNVFEYGCGLSSLYFGRKCNYCGVENNEGWYQKVTGENPGLKVLFERDMERYVNAVDMCGFDDFDLIVVDGIFRNESLIKAEKTMRNGYIILDDANRDEYNYGFMDQKYEHWTFGGLKMNTFNINSKGYFEGNYTRLWKITKADESMKYI
jgi:hypothetical protein